MGTSSTASDGHWTVAMDTDQQSFRLRTPFPPGRTGYGWLDVWAQPNAEPRVVVDGKLVGCGGFWRVEKFHRNGMDVSRVSNYLYSAACFEKVNHETCRL